MIMIKGCHLYIGDMAYFLNLTIPQNIILILVSLYVIILQLIIIIITKWYKTYGLRVFQMMSGLIAPKSIGIYDKKLIFKFD